MTSKTLYALLNHLINNDLREEDRIIWKAEKIRQKNNIYKIKCNAFQTIIEEVGTGEKITLKNVKTIADLLNGVYEELQKIM